MIQCYSLHIYDLLIREMDIFHHNKFIESDVCGRSLHSEPKT